MSKRRETAVEVMDAFEAWDLERIMAYRSEDCIHQVAPKSLKQAPKNNTEYRAYFGAMIPLFTRFTPTIHQIVEDPAANTVAIWCASEGDTVLGPYANEYVLVLSFNEAGDKVTKLVEFVDSAHSIEFYTRLAAFQKAKREEAASEKGSRI